MTQGEKYAAEALSNCSFLPGSFDKKFVRQITNWHDRDMTDNGRETLKRLLMKYRRQIPEYMSIIVRINGDQKLLK